MDLPQANLKSRQRRMGVSQGRLVRPYNGELQCFPKDLWETEFYLAGSVGLGHIELLSERNYNSENPLWSEAGLRKLMKAADEVGLTFYSACNDYVIDHSLLSDSSALEASIALLKPMKKLGCSLYVLPFFEKSEMNGDNSDDFIPAISEIAQFAAKLDIHISLETLVSPQQLLSLISKINLPNVGVCFDTGNRAAAGSNLASEIRLLNQSINHVHFKDKIASGANVILGTGLVNFLDVCTELSMNLYSGRFTFETNRGRDPVRTMEHNIQMLNFMMEEARL